MPVFLPNSNLVLLLIPIGLFLIYHEYVFGGFMIDLKAALRDRFNYYTTFDTMSDSSKSGV